MGKSRKRPGHPPPVVAEIAQGRSRPRLLAQTEEIKARYAKAFQGVESVSTLAAGKPVPIDPNPDGCGAKFGRAPEMFGRLRCLLTGTFPAIRIYFVRKRQVRHLQ